MAFIDNYVPTVIYLFLFYALVSTNSLMEILPCQTQFIMSNNMYVKHLLGFLTIFTLIMGLSGGWDFDKEEEKKRPKTWSNGNALHTLAYSLILYLIFMLSSKMTGFDNLIFFLVLFVIYIINTQKNYWKTKEKLSKVAEKRINISIKIGLAIVALLFVFNSIRYFLLKKREYKEDFLLKKFLVGTTTCRKNSNIDNWGFVNPPKHL